MPNSSDLWSGKKVEALSKGMSQKIQFIISVLHQPEIIILDEPFTGLDPVNAEVLRSSILELREKGATIIFSTHDMNMAEKMCDFIFMIYKGKMVLDGTLNEIQDTYATDTIRMQTEGGSGLYKNISILQCGGGFPTWTGENMIYTACPDGIRPVCFKLERTFD